MVKSLFVSWSMYSLISLRTSVAPSGLVPQSRPGVSYALPGTAGVKKAPALNIVIPREENVILGLHFSSLLYHSFHLVSSFLHFSTFSRSCCSELEGCEQQELTSELHQETFAFLFRRTGA